MLKTARLTLAPVDGADLPGLIALKADPRVYAQMLGGVRSRWQVIDELAEDRAFWAAHRIGMFAIREGAVFQGITGLHARPDGRGLALRFAVWPEARGRGLAREAASAALRFAHDRIGVPRIVAVARAENFGSRMVLGSIGMRPCDAFLREGHTMLVLRERIRSRPDPHRPGPDTALDLEAATPETRAVTRHLAALLLAAAPACAQTPPADATVAQVLAASAADWSRGDLAAFMAASYENAPRTAFMTQAGLITGYDAIKAYYAAHYGTHTLGQLTLAITDSRPLDPAYVLVTGRFNLKRERGPVAGNFTLLMHHSAAGWRIAYDHSS